jgi:hypothetical protein
MILGLRLSLRGSCAPLEWGRFYTREGYLTTSCDSPLSSVNDDPNPQEYAGSRQGHELDDVAVGIGHVELLGAVRAQAPRQVLDPEAAEMVLPGPEVGDAKRVVVPSVVAMDEERAPAGEVELLAGAQPAPLPSRCSCSLHLRRSRM